MDSSNMNADVSLPVLRNKNYKRRWTVLWIVQLLIIAHVVFWALSKKYGWFGGATLTPIEPSEGMELVKNGVINAGAIFFILALISTLIFGRWFCGWGCHVVLLQDGCYWLLRKIGIRPKPFRSRLLMWFPFALGVYMFIWPLFYRIAVAPFVQPELQWPGVTTHLTTTEFWNTFPPAHIAIPFLFICGFLTVYVLGAKGFCSYGCPYGGFFKPLDKASPMRIRVNDNCGQCGKCTAACTSNVRVHEEVNIHKMVIDSGCMKIMDCVDACPNEALSVGFGETALGKEDTKQKQDLTINEEIVFATLFVIAFLGYRGLYASTPMLMAVGMALVTMWFLVKTWALMKDENVNVHKTQLKFHGSMKKQGFLFLVLSLVVGLFFLQSVAVTAFHSLGDKSLNNGDAQSAIKFYTLSGPIGDGGVGLLSNPNVDTTLAKLHEQENDFAESERLLWRAAEQVGRDERVYMLIGQTKQMTGSRMNVDAFYTDNLLENPEWALVWEDYVAWLKRQQLFDASIAASEHAIAYHPENPRLILQYGLLMIEFGNPNSAVEIFTHMTEAMPSDPSSWMLLSKAHTIAGNEDAAKEAFERGSSLQNRN
ncbi:MAG: 4Fe-4S binding protein [Phycisphaerales bacterium]|nr:4Fe-4S binding protein [Phycisphaerales bacterium]